MNIEELKKIPSLVRWSKNEQGFPVRVDLSITNNCNLQCYFCKQGINQIKHTNELTKEELLDIIREGYNLGVFNWNIVGEGEPLLKTDTTIEVMTLIKKYSMMGNLTTNGTLFNKSIVSKVIDIEWDCINFSIDSSEKKVHDYLRGKKGAFDKAKNAMILFKKLKQISKRKKPTIIIHSIIHNQNYDTLKEMVDLAHDVNAQKLDFTHILPLTNFTEKLALNKEQLNQFYDTIPNTIEYAYQKKILTNLGDYNTSININKSQITQNKKERKTSKNWLFSAMCYNPWVSMIVLANGLVGPCCRYSDEKYMGNIRKENLNDIWFGKRFNDFREKMKDNKLECIKECPSTEIIRNNKIKEELIKLYSNSYFKRCKNKLIYFLKTNNFINI